MAMDPRYAQMLMMTPPENPGLGAVTNPSPPPMADLQMTPGFQGGMGGFTPPSPGGGMGSGGIPGMPMPGGPDPLGGEGLQYGFGIDGQQQSFGFDNALTPQGVDSFRLNQGLTPEPRLAEDRMMLPPFARPQAEFDAATGQMRIRQPKNYSLQPQQPQRFGTDPITGEEYGAGPVDKFPPRGAQYPGTISSMFGGRF